MATSTNDTNDESIDELEQLLLEAECDLETNKIKQNTADDSLPTIKSHAGSNIVIPPKQNKETSIVHNDNNLDSSDDEDLANFLEQKYNEYGRDVNKALKKQKEEIVDRKIDREVAQNIQNQSIPKPHQFPIYNAAQSAPTPNTTVSFNSTNKNVGIYTDPVFGLRIVHPLISSASMLERMQNRKAVTVSSVEKHITSDDLKKDWAIAGVLVSKGPMSTSKKGTQYTIWKLSDLRGEIKMISLFLFKSACKELWKTAQGMVVAILNPGVLDKNSNQKDEICLSVDTAQKFMILGQSKDLGWCKSKKKNGDVCNAVVNKNMCEFCVYHVKQEYGKLSGRVELQSATSGRGLQSLRNKVLGNSEVFYAGQSFTAIKAKKNPKQIAKDQKRLLTLSEYYHSPTTNTNSGATSSQIQTNRFNLGKTAATKQAHTIEASLQQRKKDIDRLKLLTGDKPDDTQTQPQIKQPLISTQPKEITSLQFAGREFSLAQKPMLKQDGFSFNLSVSQKMSDLSKFKALEVLKKKPLEKSNPNFIKHRGTVNGKKRALEEIVGRDETAAKKAKITEAAEKFQNERIQKILQATSSHGDLIVAHQNDAQDKYFDKLEKKEAMEEKMLSTYKIDCKAVVCLKCRYTAFSAAERCKEERHPIKVIDAEKRFYECLDCGGRTATVHRMPQMSCKNCQSSRWQRTAMIKDKKTDHFGDKLSIRGDEEMFIGSMKSNGNMNLCVADE